MFPSQVQKKPEPLTEDMISEVREVFTLFDKDSDGFVNTDELGNLLRVNNMNPSNDEVEIRKVEIDPNKTGKFSFNDYLKIVANRGKDQETIDDLIEAFKTFLENKEDTKINVQRFKFSVTALGEKMDESEINEILNRFNLVHEDNINIAEFAKIIMTH